MAARLVFLAAALASFESDGVPPTGLSPFGAAVLAWLTGLWPFPFLPVVVLRFAFSSAAALSSAALAAL